jgi:hypothetical protein
VKLPSGIGIGSTSDEVLREYGEHVIPDFKPMLTSEEVIALGESLNGVYFVIRDNLVYSIYVGTVGETSGFAWFLEHNIAAFDLYPAYFYPDREYAART